MAALLSVYGCIFQKGTSVHISQRAQAMTAIQFGILHIKTCSNGGGTSSKPAASILLAAMTAAMQTAKAMVFEVCRKETANAMLATVCSHTGRSLHLRGGHASSSVMVRGYPDFSLQWSKNKNNSPSTPKPYPPKP